MRIYIALLIFYDINWREHKTKGAHMDKNKLKNMLRTIAVASPAAIGAALFGVGLHQMDWKSTETDTGAVLFGLGASILVIWLAYIAAYQKHHPRMSGNLKNRNIRNKIEQNINQKTR